MGSAGRLIKRSPGDGGDTGASGSFGGKPTCYQRGLGDNSVTRYPILAPGDRLIRKLGRCRPGFTPWVSKVKKKKPRTRGVRRGFRFRLGGTCDGEGKTHHNHCSTPPVSSQQH
jgi:hypothetical protein